MLPVTFLFTEVLHHLKKKKYLDFLLNKCFSEVFTLVFKLGFLRFSGQQTSFTTNLYIAESLGQISTSHHKLF